MNFRNMIQLGNLILALLAVPPSLSLFRALFEENNVVKGDVNQVRLNKIVRVMFVGVATLASLNAILSFLVIVDLGLITHNVSPVRSLLLNAFLAGTAWKMESYRRHLNDN